MQRILVAIDGSSIALHAADTASDLASHSGAEVTLASVVEPPQPATDLPSERTLRALLDALRSTGEGHLHEAQRRCHAHGVEAKTMLREGDPASELLRMAKEINADLIVCGSHGRGFIGRMMLGSVSSKLVHRSGVPVLVVPAPPTPAEAHTTDVSSPPAH